MQTEAKVRSVAVPHVGLLPKLRYYWTFVVAALCFVIMGIPVIPVAYILRKFFRQRAVADDADDVALTELPLTTSGKLDTRLSDTLGRRDDAALAALQ